jgi:hypothetical protein
MAVALKRVVLPSSHITLSPLNASTVLTSISSPTKQQQINHTSNVDPITPLSIAQATYAAAGHGHTSAHGHSQSKKFASLPTHSPTVADRLVDKLVTSPLRPSTSSGALATPPLGRGKQQTVIQNAGAALTSYSDHYSDMSSCDFMDEQQRRAVRAELASTQAYEAIQARMLSGDYSLLEETSVVPSSTPRREEGITSPRGHASGPSHRSTASRAPSVTGTTVHKLGNSRGASSSDVHSTVSFGASKTFSTKHSGSGSTGSRGVPAVVSSTAVHIKTTSIAHQTAAPLRFG